MPDSLKTASLPFMTSDLLEQLYTEIPKARDLIYQVGDKTPLTQINLAGLKDIAVFIKREDLGPINAYKWRGGYNAVYNHHKETGCDTIIAASAGNHAQGVALAARKLNIKAKIFMPLAAPIMKQEAVKRHGGDNVELILTGDTYNEAGDAAKAYVAETGFTYIHPFDDLYTMAGQAMIADEVIDESKDAPFDYAFLQIGGGGMAGAVSAWLKKHYPNITIIGVEGDNQASMKTSVESGSPLTLDSVDTFCDGTAVTRPGDLTFQVCKDTIDEFVTVSNEEVSAAIRQLWEAKRLIPEPSGAMGVAGLYQYAEKHPERLKGKKVLTIICGANMDFSKLSLLTAKSSITGQQRRYYNLNLPEAKGALLQVLDAHFQNMNVCEFMYGKTHETKANQTIAIEASNNEFEVFEANLETAGISFSNISKEADIQYKIINYNPALFHDPIFMNVRFPERKGALRELLRAISPVASICYFNYAYSGEVIGRALMGFEFENTENKQKFLQVIDNSIVTCSPLDEQTVERILQH